MFPNVYGIDMPTKAELICGDGKSEEEVARVIGADAVVYQTLEGLKNALHDMNPSIPRFDCSCFDGEYVTGDVTEEYLAKLGLSNAAPAAKKPADDDSEDEQAVN